MAIRTITDLPYFELSSDEDIERLKNSTFEVSLISGEYTSGRYISRAIKGTDLISCLQKNITTSGIYENVCNFNEGIRIKKFMDISGDIEINDGIDNPEDYKLNIRTGQMNVYSEGVEVKTDRQLKIDGIVNISKYATVDRCDGSSNSQVVNIGYLNNVLGKGDVATQLKTVYPIGSVYISVNKTLPPEFLLGMTWQLISKGRCLWGYDGESDNIATNIEQGLPEISGNISGLNCETAGSHTHKIYTTKNVSSSDSCCAADAGTGYVNTDYAGEHTHNITGNVKIKSDSGIYGRTENVQPPAFVVSMWQRIS